MPKPYENAPTVTRTFAGVDCAVPEVFAEGATLTGPTRKWANTQVGTVVGNAFGSRVRKGCEALNAKRKAEFKAKTYTGPLGEDGKPAPATAFDLWEDPAAEFATVFAEYELGAGRAAGEGKASSSDPVDRTIRFLAEEDLKARILRNGKTIKEFMQAAPNDAENFKSRYGELLAASIALGTNKDGSRNWREEAEEIVRRRAEAEADNAADDDLTLAPTPEVSAAA